MILEVKNLNHTYMSGTVFSKTALTDINFSVKKGEFIGLIGHSGSGKSTLIQHLNGLLSPNSGEVIVDGVNIFSDKKTLREARAKVGLVFQYPEQQLFEETVFKDIAFGPKNMGIAEDEITKRVKQACELAGINEKLLSKSPFELSGGQKRRVAIAGVVAMKPQVLILDEPTAGLDPKGRNKILNSIKALHSATDMTVILVSHSMEDIANNVDRIMVMNRGKLVMDDKKEKVFERADELKAMGLGIPMVSEVFMRLKQKGYNLPDGIYTVEQAKEAIKNIIKEER